MKAICAFCGFRNVPEANGCAQCGASLANAARETFRMPWATWVPAIPIAIFCVWQFLQIQRADAASHQENRERTEQIEIETEHAAALKKIEASFARVEAEEETKHQSLLGDTQFISGRKAAERHSSEWTRRQQHDPAFVSTLLEQTLVEIEKLGADPNLTAETSLKRVAEKVCPPGSRIEVAPSGDRFIVRVAFRLSAVAPMEAGTFTLHQSASDMRWQVEEATARLIQALFDYCGSRGIERISASCNRALVEGETGVERLHMRSLYRASIDAAKASEVANWRTTPLTQIKRLFRVEHDMLSQITFGPSNLPGLALDPNEPLEF